MVSVNFWKFYGKQAIHHQCARIWYKIYTWFSKFRNSKGNHLRATRRFEARGTCQVQTSPTRPGCGEIGSTAAGMSRGWEGRELGHAKKGLKILSLFFFLAEYLFPCCLRYNAPAIARMHLEQLVSERGCAWQREHQSQPNCEGAQHRGNARLLPLNTPPTLGFVLESF